MAEKYFKTSRHFANMVTKIARENLGGFDREKTMPIETHVDMALQQEKNGGFVFPSNGIDTMCRTVGDIVDLINSNLKSESDELRAHASTLLGPRTNGSTTTIGIDAVPRYIAVKKHSRESQPQLMSRVASGCELYSFEYEMGGVIGAYPFYEIQAMGIYPKVTQFPHGLALTCESEFFDEDERKCTTIYVIVGSDNGERAVFTWHPGEPLVPLSEGIQDYTAVKLIGNQ